MELSAFPYPQDKYGPVDEERDLAEDPYRLEGELARYLDAGIDIITTRIKIKSAPQQLT